jgi:hypothetical protein
MMTRALLANDGEALRAIAKDLAWARESIAEITGDPELFATYNIQMEKARIQAADYCNAGPIRPPYNVMPERYAECAKENARRWRQLGNKYSELPRQFAVRRQIYRSLLNFPSVVRRRKELSVIDRSRQLVRRGDAYLAG